MGLAQLETLPKKLKKKRSLAKKYQTWGLENRMNFVIEPKNTRSNYWLNTVITENKEQRDSMLKITNDNKVMTRPAWKPMYQLEMNSQFYCDHMTNTNWLYDRVVNVPSSPI